jgi:retron-type reverse transcriptase
MLTASKLYKSEFKYNNLINTFQNKIEHNSTQGVDGISSALFKRQIAYNLSMIKKKVGNCTYKFSPFKTTLLSRGFEKFPRKIAQPTIRDKIVLRAMYNILTAVYSEDLGKRKLHLQIQDMITTYKADCYNHILRFDIKDFFPSIDHKVLLKFLYKRIRKKELSHLLESVLSTPFDIDKIEGIKCQSRGVAQGLSIATILANIYLFNIDKKYETMHNIKYYRYVDDILIFCNNVDKDSIKNNFEVDIKNLHLELHDDEKYADIDIHKPFDYLGYSFSNGRISVREKSVKKLIESMIKIFTYNKYPKPIRLGIVLFRLNLRITGCIFDKKKYGWLFFFSQMEDEKLLHSLDHLLAVQLRRFGVDRLLVKHFVRSWYEIKFNCLTGNYIPNFDNYLAEGKLKIVKIFYPKYILDDTLDALFRKIIYREIRKIERDMSELS